MSVPQPTHERVVGTNRGEIIGWMSRYPQEIPSQIAGSLNRLGKDGGFNDVYVYYQIYPIPPGAVQGRKIDPQEWIEAAGTAERLTVEVKRKDADGVCRLYAVGRGGSVEEEVSETLRFTFTEAHVRPGEVLTAQEAIELFQHYYDHHEIPMGWELRETRGTVAISDQDAAANAAQTGFQAGSATDLSASSDSIQVGSDAVRGSSAEAVPKKNAAIEADGQQRRVDGA